MSYRFVLQSTGLPRALYFDRLIGNRAAKRWLILFFGLSILGFLGFFYLGLIESSLAPKFLGLSIIFADLAAILIAGRLYLEARLKSPPIRKPISQFQDAENLAEAIDYEVAVIFNRAFQIANRFRTGSIDDRHLMLSLVESDRGAFIFARASLSRHDIRTLITDSFSVLPGQGQLGLSEEAMAALTAGLLEANARNHPRISLEDLALGLSRTSLRLKRILFEVEVGPEDFENIIYFIEQYHLRVETERRFWEPANFKMTGGIAKDWASGWTVELQRYSRDITEQFSAGGHIEIYGHQKETAELERALARSSGANAILVGDPGVGKSTIVLGLAEKVRSGRVGRALARKHIFELDVGAILAGASNPGEVDARLIKILNEAARAGNVIVYVSDIHTLIGGQGGSQVGTIDASEAFLPYLRASSFQLIGSTTYEDYHRAIEQNRAIESLFEKIEVVPPSTLDSIRILEDVALHLESKHQVFIVYQAIKAAVELAERYIHDKPLPEKAIGLLDEAAVETAGRGEKVLLKGHVEQVVESRTDVPVSKAKEQEQTLLLNLEEIMHRRVINQTEAIKVVADAMRRVRAGLNRGKRPVGSFLFLGPTGVGKTETAKALAAAYFQSEKKMIRFDMSEYQSADSINRLIGSPNDPRSTGGLLTQAIREDPFSLILLDELEKANSAVFNLLLQVLDEGRLTDNTGRTADFTNSIIIATSNAGSEYIRQAIESGKTPADLKTDLVDYLLREAIFRPEFLNRFDAVVAFESLSLENIKKVAEIQLKEVAELVRKQDIGLEIEPAAVEILAKVGLDPVMGARPLRRAIQDRVENLIAKKLLDGSLKRGETLLIKAGDIDQPVKTRP